MQNILKSIEDNNLIKPGDVVGVAVSGGSDSMALLNYLYELTQTIEFEVVAIHIDHSIRENSSEDARFVMNYCKKKMIRAYKFKVDCLKLAEQKKQSLEEVARDARLGVFDALIQKGVVDKIAIAHNSRDQAETILINLFRGTGVAGASGMEEVRDGIYIRPMLNTSKKAILDYVFLNDIPYVEDETNKDNSFSRNYVRNLILPLIEQRWNGAVEKIVTFGKDCADDNNYINEQVFLDAIIFDEKTARIPNSYFLYPNAIVSRMIFKSLQKIGVSKDIQRVHIQMIKDLALNGENGKRINLPLSVSAFKEYDYLTITNRERKIVPLNQPFALGSFNVENFGTITVKRVRDFTLKTGELLVDGKKIPKEAVWRFKQNGDVFEKFGGGTKKLKDYLIDKKIPLRLRSTLPVLAVGNEILVIAGVEISNKLRLSPNATTATKISIS